MATGASKQWRWSEAILPAKLPVIVTPKSATKPPPKSAAAEGTVDVNVDVDVNQLIQRPPQTAKTSEPAMENAPKGKRVRGVLVTKPAPVSPRDTRIFLTGKAVQPKLPSADVRKDRVLKEANKNTPQSSAKSHKMPLNPSNPLALHGRQTLAELAVSNYQKQVEQYIKQASVSRNRILKPALPSVFRA